MIKFIKIPDKYNPHDKIYIEMNLPDKASFDEVISMVEDFLTACGYNLPDTIEFRPDNELEN